MPTILKSKPPVQDESLVIEAQQEAAGPLPAATTVASDSPTPTASAVAAPQQSSWIRALSAWIARAASMLIVLAITVVAALAVTHAWDLRQQADRDRQQIASLTNDLSDVRSTSDKAIEDVAKADVKLATSRLKLEQADKDVEAARAERDQLRATLLQFGGATPAA